MRVTNNSGLLTFMRSLEDTQSKIVKEEMRISTGQQLQSIADDPKMLYNSKQVSSVIERNNEFIKNINTGIAEMSLASETLESISNNMTRLRELTIDASQTGNYGNLPSIGAYVKGILEDIVRDANNDFDGKFLFAGTKTTPDSIVPQDNQRNNLPFEILQGESTPENMTGLSVVFKGNNNNRFINKDNQSTEIINNKAVEIFGEQGSAVFNAIIGIYNILMYDNEGNKRHENSVLRNEEKQELNDFQAQIARIIHQIDNVSGINGAKINRLEAIRDMMTSENIQLKDYRSVQSDTDIAASSIELKKNESALRYSLQVGGTLFRQSLFDFIR